MKRIATALVTRIGPNYGLAPYGLALAGLGTCTAITLKMYANRDAHWDSLIEIAGKTPVTKTLQAGATITAVRARP